MKKSSSLLIIIPLLVFCVSCNGQDHDAAVKKANEIQTAVKKNRPGTIPTTGGGYNMKAKIDGKDWVAVSMMPFSATSFSQVIGYAEEGGYYILLNVDKTDKAGKIIKLKEGGGEGANIFVAATKESLTDAITGEIEITRQDGEWTEGNFHLTVRLQSGKKVEVTDGFFRVK